MKKCFLLMTCTILIFVSVSQAGSLTFGGRQWTTRDCEYSTYSATATSGTATGGYWFERLDMYTPLDIHVGDVITYDWVHTGEGGSLDWADWMLTGFISPFDGVVDIQNTVYTYETYALEWHNTWGYAYGASLGYTWEFISETQAELTVVDYINPESTYAGTYTMDLATGTSAITGFLGEAYSTMEYFTISNFVHTSVYRTNTPDPVVNESQVETDLSERDVTGAISWTAPTDADIVAIAGYDVYFDPNQALVMTGDPSVKKATNQASTSYTPSLPLDLDKNYFWRVDAHVDYASIPGTDPNTVVGDVWWFTTAPPAPFIEEFDNVITATALLPASVSTIVTDGDNNLSSATFTVLEDDPEYPIGATYVLTPNMSNLYAPTATFSPDMPGTYKIKLDVSDADEAMDTAIAVVQVYADACDAAKNNPNGWPQNYYDRDGNCHVDILDFAEFALEWLDDTSLSTQDTYQGAVYYIPIVNGIPDGNFEASPAGGQAYGLYNDNGVITNADEDVYEGSQAYAFDDYSGGAMSLVLPAGSHSITFWYKGNLGELRVGDAHYPGPVMAITNLSASPTGTGYTVITGAVGSYTKYTVEFDIAEAGQAEFWFFGEGVTAGLDGFIDDIRLNLNVAP